MASYLASNIANLESDRAALKRFIGDASHELKTPITALKTFNELLARDALALKEPASSFISDSKGQLSKLDRITSDLLDLSRLEARLSGTDVHLGDVRNPVSNAVHGLRALIDARNLTIQLDLPEDPVLMRFDSAALEKAFSNLIDNAIKFSADGAIIEVKLSVKNSLALITVRDYGQGILEDEMGIIFDRFHRGSNARSEGSGLGLVIVQEIVSIHGGQLSAHNGEDGGCIFEIDLPMTGDLEAAKLPDLENG
jgi:signal transduction histidine kinase